MEWSSQITNWVKENPASAGLIVGGVAAASATAFVLTTINLDDRWPSILILIGFGLLVALLGAVLAIAWVRTALGGFLVVSALLWVGLFGYSRIVPDDQRVQCLVYFWQDCRTVADRAAAQAVAGEQIEATEDDVFNRSGYLVFMQFAGDITRDSIRETMRSLASEGWNVQGVEGGGQRTTAAAGYSEVRYGRAEDEEAAQALAIDLSEQDMLEQDYTTKLVQGIQPHNLEIWLSR